MTCQECELALAGEDRIAMVEDHLAGCAACREFEVELRENSQALRALAMEPVPVGLALGRTVAEHGPAPLRHAAHGAAPLRHAAHGAARYQPAEWWGAVAAVLVIGFVSSWAMLRSRSASSHVLAVPSARIAVPAGEQAAPAGAWQATRSPAPLKTAAAPVRHRAPNRSRSQENNEPRILQVKMLTDDPNVVIYWQIEN
jgi:hypothetical protein